MSDEFTDTYLVICILVGAVILGVALLSYPWHANGAQVGGGFLIGSVVDLILSAAITSMIVDGVP